jgi:hypothetical protein
MTNVLLLLLLLLLVWPHPAHLHVSDAARRGGVAGIWLWTLVAAATPQKVHVVTPLMALRL